MQSKLVNDIVAIVVESPLKEKQDRDIKATDKVNNFWNKIRGK